MKICFLLPAHWTAVLGGSEIQIKYLIDALIERGDFDITYICRHTAETHIQGVLICRIKHNSANRLARTIHSLDYFQILNFLEQLSPDAIYTRTDSPYVGIAARYCKHSKCRLVWHIAHQRDVERYKIRDLRSLVGAMDRKLFEYGVRRADVIIGQAKYQDLLLRDNFGRACTDIIPNFHPEAGPIEKKDDQISVVWVANVKRAKRPGAFLALAKALARCREVHFLMIGSIQDDYWKGRLQKEIDGLDNLTYLGGLPLDEVNEILSKSHIFVNTSESEGFPNTFVQAWLRKVVVVSLSVDPDDILSKGGYGYLSGEVGKLIEDVQYLATHDSERRSMAERSFKYALDTYSLRNIDRLLTHFTQK